MSSPIYIQCQYPLTFVKRLTYNLSMTPKEVIALFGDGKLQVAARELGLSRQTLYNWREANRVPARWQYWLERETAGKLRATHERPNNARAKKSRT